MIRTLPHLRIVAALDSATAHQRNRRREFLRRPYKQPGIEGEAGSKIAVGLNYIGTLMRGVTAGLCRVALHNVHVFFLTAWTPSWHMIRGTGSLDTWFSGGSNRSVISSAPDGSALTDH